MAKPHGLNTRAVAEKLTEMINAGGKRYDGIRIFYDHGDSSNLQVCQPTTYMGRRYGHDATLSGVDIVVLKDNNVIVAVEIEESKVRPKTILGDIFGIVLADKMRIKVKPYPITNATVIIAIAANDTGKQPDKYTRLKRRIDGYLEKNPSESVGKVQIITCSADDLVRRIERLIRLETGKHI